MSNNFTPTVKCVVDRPVCSNCPDGRILKVRTCTAYCTKLEEIICPECGNIMDVENEGTSTGYHGPDCGHCGWHHCGGCV
jgi:hypothetical protein